MGAGIQLAGLRKDGTTFPARVSLTPVTTASGQLTLAIIRDITGTGRLDDLAGMAWDAAEAQRGHLQLLDAVITGVFHAGLGLQAAEGLPADDARHRIEASSTNSTTSSARSALPRSLSRPAPARPPRPWRRPVTPSAGTFRGPGTARFSVRSPRQSACRPPHGPGRRVPQRATWCPPAGTGSQAGLPGTVGAEPGDEEDGDSEQSS
jgi:hypothetical protein